MNTTWYLQSHFVWLRLSCSSIDEVSSRVLGGSRLEASSVGRLPEMSNCYCHPGRAGGSLGYSRRLGRLFRSVPKCGRCSLVARSVAAIACYFATTTLTY